MCGIVGKQGNIELDVEAGLDAIAARGPDGRGAVTRGATIHGHVRLAIMGGVDQPYVNGPSVLSYAGECWNAEDLRGQLAAQGERFAAPESDTEVIEAALRRWGPTTAASAIEGMFAIAWTHGEDTFLIRDKIGKVPLYVHRNGDGTVWAVERKALGPWKAVASPVPPGTAMQISKPLGEAVAAPYYTVEPRLDVEMDDAGLQALLIQAVLSHCAGDVSLPMAVCLSGGLDSALVAAIAVELGYRPLCFHAVVTDGQPDLEAARTVARDLGLDLIEVPSYEAPTIGEMERAIERIELGNRVAVDIAIISMRIARVMQAAGIKVVLTGDGADELFGGYGNLARKAKNDDTWRAARLHFYRKLSRSDFPRANKAFLGFGVEPRAPLSDRRLAEVVLGMTKAQCPPGKKLLMRLAERWLPTAIVRRKKETFQGALARLMSSERQVLYNSMLKARFGALVKG